MNDLAMLIEASEIFTEAEYNKKYNALIKEINVKKEEAQIEVFDLGGFE